MAFDDARGRFMRFEGLGRSRPRAVLWCAPMSTRVARSSSGWLALAAVLLLAPGCARVVEEGDLEPLGLVGASSEPPPGLMRPVVAEDLVAVHRRGVHVHRMERALRLAYEQGVMSVGNPGTNAVLPLVDVDPGGRSAQVLFVRWRPGTDGQMPPLLVENAERWLLVSLLLNPDRILDVELLQGGLDKGHTADRVAVMLAAATRAREIPDAMFHMLDVYEQVPVEPDKPAKGNKVIGHLYALSADADGPDLEFEVDLPQRRQAAAVLKMVEVHQPGATLVDPIKVQTPTPGPITVARVMLRGAEAGEVFVRAGDQAWTVAAATGVLSRAPGDP